MARPKILHLGAGLEIVDEGALSQEQQQKLKDFKEITKLKNEKYLREHPEIDCMIALFLQEVFIKRPENLLHFSSDFFMRSTLRQEVQNMLAKKYPPNIRYFERFREAHTNQEMLEFLKDPKFWSHMNYISVPPTPKTSSEDLSSASGETIDVGLESILGEEEIEEEEEEEIPEEFDILSIRLEELATLGIESDTDTN